MAADPFRFVDRWSNSLRDLLGAVLPDAEPMAREMLMQKLDERDLALELYLQRWLAPITQVAGAATLAGATSGTAVSTMATVTLSAPIAGGIWRCEGYVNSLIGTVGDVNTVKLMLGATVLDSTTFAGTGSLAGQLRFSGVYRVTDQAIRAGTAPTTLSLTVQRTGSGSGTSWSADNGGASANRVSGTFIPLVEGTG